MSLQSITSGYPQIQVFIFVQIGRLLANVFGAHRPTLIFARCEK
jgi:hypothetical protein